MLTTKNLPSRYFNESKESIVALNQTGRSVNSLSKEYNVSVSTISKWINQADPKKNVLLQSLFLIQKIEKLEKIKIQKDW